MLTGRQQEIWSFLTQYVDEHGYPPTVREIGEAVGLSSSSTVHNHLNQLERLGLIRRDPTKSRTVQLVEQADTARMRRQAVAVPVVGNVAAGTPILAEEHIEDHLLLSPEIAQEGWFGLRVRGDSMVGAGILDGDMVIVRPQKDAPDGTIVVALVEDEATVKRLDRQQGHVRLISENPDYAPIEPEQVEMVGAVRGVLRTY